MDIKQSTHKTVKAFLKASAKEGLIKLKETKGDVVITGASSPFASPLPDFSLTRFEWPAVYPAHPAVAGHKPHKTVQSVEEKREKTEERQRKAQEAEEKKRSEIHIAELWKPHGPTVGWFVAAEKKCNCPFHMSLTRY